MLKTVIIKGFILLKSGLHIGGSEAGVHIGGIDNPVIKNPLTNMPYIPGSSLKGKMRFLLEHSLGLVQDSLVEFLDTLIIKNSQVPLQGLFFEMHL